MGVHFVDEARILVRSGAGGAGCCSFRREKCEPRGGPDGGDGGRGGDVVLRASVHITTLLDLGRRHRYVAERGAHGRGKNCTGRAGKSMVIGLPVGTRVHDARTGELIVDLDTPDQDVFVARGGKGGRGNAAFATSTHQAPREWERGVDGQELELVLELRLMADVGLLGLPNAGKSTFLARVSAAHPRIADYPFTTLAPQLGIVELDAERRLVVADIPGIIEGAHHGAGLGLGFLRHLSRTRILLHLLDVYDRSPEQLADDYQVIRDELVCYSPQLGERSALAVLNKIDLIPTSERASLVERFQALVPSEVRAISGVSGEGIPELLERAWQLVFPEHDPGAQGALPPEQPGPA